MLSEMIAKAKAWLGRTPVAPPPPATDAVVTDEFDRVVFDELLDEAPALRRAVEQMEAEGHEHARDLFSDTLQSFWQSRPEIRKAEEMAESHLLNHAVAEMMRDLPEAQEARAYTAWDRYGSALATIGVGERVADFVEEATERQREAEDAQKAAEEALKEAQERLQEALQAAEQVDEEEDPEGAAAAGQELEEAGQAAAEAEAGVEQATQALTTTAQQSAERMGRAVADALDATQERLEEESELFEIAGIPDSQVERMSFTERARMADHLRTTKLARFRKMIGRMKRLSSGYRTKKIEHGRDEAIDVELSGDLSRVLTSEILLSDIDEIRELDFIQRMVEGRLLSRKFVGIEEAGDGPIVIALDESGSMDGEKEAWSKAFALALYDQARKARRDLVWIGWAAHGQQIKWTFPKGQGQLEDLIEAVEHFYRGNDTAYEPALRMSLDAVVHDFDANGRNKADIVFVSDGQGRVSPDFLDRFLAEKERVGFRVFGVGVDMDPGGMRAFSDQLYHVSDLATGEDASTIFATI